MEEGHGVGLTRRAGPQTPGDALRITAGSSSGQGNLRQVVAQIGEEKEKSKKSLNHGGVLCLKEVMGAPK